MLRRLKFYLSLDRIGPDMMLTHWILYFKWLTRLVYKRRFYYFARHAEVRPGSYLLNIETISLGEKVIIRPLSYIAGETLEHTNGKPSIVVEKEVLLSPGVHIYPSNHKFADSKTPIINQGDTKPKVITIKKGSWVGANAVILQNVTIGENSVIGAGSIVTKNIPARVVAAGNPARIVKRIKNA